MSKQNTINFANFLKKQVEFFTTVEEKEDYNYHLQGILDHLNDILELIFGNTGDLSDEEHSLYTKLFLRSLSRDLTPTSGTEHPVQDKDVSQSSMNKFDTTLKKYIERSSR